MNILCINASPRMDGNCRILLQEVVKGAKDAGRTSEIIDLDILNISPWREPNASRNLGQDPIKDDMSIVETKIMSSDVIILASPIYFGSISAQAKIMIDRSQVVWERAILLKEKVREKKAKAALICVEASDRDDFFQNAKQIAKNFFAVIKAEYVNELFCTGLEQAKAVLKCPEYLKKAYDLGKNT